MFWPDPAYGRAVAFRWPLSRSRSQTAFLPWGVRVYAIGDIHGEAGMLASLLARIEADSAEREQADIRIILLGDFIDRGPHSAELLRALASADDPRLVVLKGNHEATMVDAYRGDKEAFGFWLRYGGDSTMLSFGASPRDMWHEDTDTLLETLRRIVSTEIIEWLDGLPQYYEVGDYFFTHAGIRPGVPLDQQAADDLLWIRSPFLESRLDHGKVIVHGHSVEPLPMRLGRNRIGIDSGAHENGVITALGLQDSDQWLIQVEADRRDIASVPQNMQDVVELHL